MSHIDLSTIPVGVTAEWLEALEAEENLPKNVKKAAIEKAIRLGEEAAAREKIKAIEIARKETRDAFLEDTPDTPLPIDPDKGILAAAKKLHAFLRAHTEATPGKRTGTVNTALDYILAHIFLLEDAKLSKRPLHDLRNIHTEEQAATCGISYRNLAMIWKCLVSLEKSKKTGNLPIGNEPRLADLAATMVKDALKAREEEAAARETLSRAKIKSRRLAHSEQARKAFFPGYTGGELKDFKVSSPEQKRISDAEEGEADVFDFNVTEAGADGVEEDEDALVEKLRLENKMLIEKALGKKTKGL